MKIAPGVEIKTEESMRWSILALATFRSLTWLVFSKVFQDLILQGDCLTGKEKIQAERGQLKTFL
eukprot:433936-Hanusia_phi.AAC.1